jgi:phosphinothricin acetyltransferase
MPIVTIRAASQLDAPAIATIYNPYITGTTITFEEEQLNPGQIAKRMEEVQSTALPWLVAETDREILGYAVATPWRSRAAYRFSVEITVYISPSHTRRGIGSLLYGQLFPLLQARGIHAVMAGIALPNDASVALHEIFGLRKVAHLSQVGFKFDRWIDVGYWQRNIHGNP